jgi:hypothetical protein
MKKIEGKVIDGVHPGLEKGSLTKTGDEVFIKIIEKNRSHHPEEPGAMM